MTTVKDTFYPEIPLNAGQVEGWKDIPIREAGNSDPLVPLGLLSPEATTLMTSSVYFGEHTNSPYTGRSKLEGSLLTLFVRRSTARRLLIAEQQLPRGHHLLIFDAYRPYQVQKSLHGFYKEKLKEKYPDANDEMLELETQKYVSLPSTNPARPSPHSTGGVVDVAIIKLDPLYEEELQRLRSRLAGGNLDFAKRVGLEMRLSAIMRHYGKMLDFGTAFDHGSEKAALAYYEFKVAAGKTLTNDETRACNNRRLLFKVMTEAGFQPYSAEWWHFDAPETQWGAATAGSSYATFGAAMLNKSNKDHEKERLKIYEIALRLHKEGGQAVARTPVQAEVLTVIHKSGDPRTSGDWPTEVIAPET